MDKQVYIADRLMFWLLRIEPVCMYVVVCWVQNIENRNLSTLYQQVMITNQDNTGYAPKHIPTTKKVLSSKMTQQQYTTDKAEHREANTTAHSSSTVRCYANPSYDAQYINGAFYVHEKPPSATRTLHELLGRNNRAKNTEISIQTHKTSTQYTQYSNIGATYPRVSGCVSIFPGPVPPRVCASIGWGVASNAYEHLTFEGRLRCRSVELQQQWSILPCRILIYFAALQ